MSSVCIQNRINYKTASVSCDVCNRDSNGKIIRVSAKFLKDNETIGKIEIDVDSAKCLMKSLAQICEWTQRNRYLDFSNVCDVERLLKLVMMLQNQVNFKEQVINATETNLRNIEKQLESANEKLHKYEEMKEYFADSCYNCVHFDADKFEILEKQIYDNAVDSVKEDIQTLQEKVNFYQAKFEETKSILSKSNDDADKISELKSIIE